MGAPIRSWPVSDAQALWLDRRDQGAFDPSFLLVDTLRWHGDFDLSRFLEALTTLVERHEVLRTRLELRRGEWRQIVYPPSPPIIVFEGVNRAEGESLDETATRLRVASWGMQVDPDHLPRLTATVHALAHDDHVVSIATHHTVADGVSFNVLLRELGVLYRDGADADLPDPVSFGSSAVVQRRFTQEPEGSEIRGGWHARLDGSPFFTLPVDRVVTDGEPLNYANHRVDFEPDLARAVLRRSAEARATANMVALSAMVRLASTIRPDQPDPVVNTLSAGRMLPGFADVVGPLLNFIPMKVGASSDDTPATLISKTRSACLWSWANELPVGFLEKEVPDLVTPLMDEQNCDFTFSFVRHRKVGSAVGPNVDNVLADESPTLDIPGGSLWDVTHDSEGSMALTILYPTTQFDEATIASWASEYVEALEWVTGTVAVPADGEQRTVPLLPPQVDEDAHAEAQLASTGEE